jgi:diaminopimelate decarboxylase
MKKEYVKPGIVKVGSPLYAKHGSAKQSYQQIRKEIDGNVIGDLVHKHGSPLFVFSENNLRKKYREAYSAMEKHYPDVTFGWSYKTNYLNGICKVFHEEGAIAEVVSHFEYEKARALGVPGNKIIYNGPYKHMAGLKQAIVEGAQIHVDNFYEIEDIEKIAKELNIVVKIGMRLNLNCGIYPLWSRFGFNLEIGQATAAMNRIHKSPNLKLTGVHTHIGTFILDINAYSEAIKKLSSFIREIEATLGYNIEFLDLGGGFASLSHLKGIYQPPEIVVPNVEQYAEAIGKELKWLAARSTPPKLYMELGRHLVDEAGYLITQVVCDKLLPDGRRSYVLDAGVNLLYTSTWYKYKIELDREVKGIMETSILNGPLCMNIDIVDEAILLPRLDRYQNIILSPVGAYNVTQWMQFIQYRPAVVMIKEDKTVKVLRRAEQLDDLNRMEEDLN